MQVTGQIEGLDELAKNLDKLKPSFERTTLRTALRNAAKPVVKLMRRFAPVERGDLKKGIRSKAKVQRNGFGYVDIGPTRDLFYAGFQELGTSEFSANPFMRPALEEGHRSKAIENEFIMAMNRTIARVLG